MHINSEKPRDFWFNNLNDRVIQECLQVRNINDNFMIIPFIGNNDSIKTLNFQSKTSKKAVIKVKSRYYFVKQIPWYCKNENFLKPAFKFYEYAFRNRLKIPRLVNTKNNKHYSYFNGDFYILTKYVDGFPWIKDTKQAQSLGSNIAKLHNIAFSYTNFNKLKYHKEPVYQSANRFLDIICKVDGSFYERYNWLKNVIENTQKELYRYNDCLCVIHGDFCPSNVIFDKHNNVVALLDFDNLKYENPARDLAETITSFAITEYDNNTSDYKKIINPINMELAEAIITAYFSSLKNPIVKKNIIKNIIPCIKIILIIFFILAHLKKNIIDDKAFDLEVAQLNRLNDYLLKNEKVLCQC